MQFLEHFGGRGTHDHESARIARILGLVLIGVGSLTTAVATWEYHIAVRYLESEGFRNVAGIPTLRREPPDVAAWMAVLVSSSAC